MSYEQNIENCFQIYINEVKTYIDKTIITKTTNTVDYKDKYIAIINKLSGQITHSKFSFKNIIADFELFCKFMSYSIVLEQNKNCDITEILKLLIKLMQHQMMYL